jgi:hypothetical protein
MVYLVSSKTSELFFNSFFMLRWLFVSILVATVLLSCFPKYERETPKMVLGYKPVFSKDTTLLRIVADTARPVKNAGKIYALGTFLFQNELGEGIHVLDNSDPTNLRNVGFLRIKGNSEVSIKGSFLYANSFADLVIVNISDWRQPREVRRLKNVFQQGLSANTGFNFMPPPERNVYYECQSWSPGSIQTGWEKDSIVNNNCYYR